MISILWIDDEIELLKPHIIYLEGKGYKILQLTVVMAQSVRWKFISVSVFRWKYGLSGLET